MKALPKRKGNDVAEPHVAVVRDASMKALPIRKGNHGGGLTAATAACASMKVPPKRKGNPVLRAPGRRAPCLNESPSEKEGKSLVGSGVLGQLVPQ